MAEQRLIDANALMERMYHDAFETDTDMQKWDSGCWIRYKMFENAIDDAQTIEERKTGKWEHGRETSRLYQGKELVGIMYEDWHCSECGLAFERSEKPIHNFCPNCGADMRGTS